MTTIAPEISIIIPVLHEVAHINRAVAAIRTLEGGDRCEVIVVDGDPERGTLDAILDPDVQRVVSDPGRGPQLNAGASVARGDILLFLHVDTFLPAGALTRIAEIMGEARCVGGSFSLAFDSDRFLHRVVAKAASWRSRLSRVPFGDQAIFIRRTYFHDIGGFGDFAVMEDVDLMLRVRRRGDRIHILNDCVRTSARRLEKEGVGFCLARGLVFLLLFSMGVSPDRLCRYYPVCAGDPSHVDNVRPDKEFQSV